ncbi:phosphonoacetaldehyde reductase [Chloroflexota bacterium]
MKPKYFGVGCLNRIFSILQRHSASRIFLVTGRNSFDTSGARDALTPYLDGKTVIRFCDFSENPKIDDVKKGVSELKQAKCDIVIAVGGGSVIDMAKLINVIASNNYEPEDMVTGKEEIKVKGLPLIAIPTTAGSGSESTHFAAVYVNNIKHSLSHGYVLPDYPLVDPSLTYNLPPKLTAVSGFDALSQAVESYWAVSATEKSQEYAYQAINMILPTLESAVNSPHAGARNTMMLAAHLAGKAINITMTTAPHAISYPMTAYFNIPHGHAVALLLGKFFIINNMISDYELHDSRGKDHLQKVMRELCELFECACPQDCSNRWYALMLAVGLETDFRSLGICHQSDIALIINNVNAERLANNPIIIKGAIIRQLFQ